MNLVVFSMRLNTGPHLTADRLLAQPTVAAWAAILYRNGLPYPDEKDDRHGFAYHLIQGTKPELPPLVLTHPSSGLISSYTKLLLQLDSDRDVYCVESQR